MKKRAVYMLAGFLTVAGLALATDKIVVLDFPLIPGVRTFLWTVEVQFDFLSDRLTNLEKTRDVFVDIPPTFDFQGLESFLGEFDRLGHRGLDRHDANGHGCTDAAAITTEQLVEQLAFSKAHCGTGNQARGLSWTGVVTRQLALTKGFSYLISVLAPCTGGVVLCVPVADDGDDGQLEMIVTLLFRS